MIYILTWNKDKYPEAKLLEMMDRFHAGTERRHRWKFGAHKQIRESGTVRHRVYLSRTGQDRPGLIGSGYVVSWPRIEKDVNGKDAWYVDVEWDYLARSPSGVLISHQDLADELGVLARAFTPQLSGTLYKHDPDELDRLWKSRIGGGP